MLVRKSIGTFLGGLILVALLLLPIASWGDGLPHPISGYILNNSGCGSLVPPDSICLTLTAFLTRRPDIVQTIGTGAYFVPGTGFFYADPGNLQGVSYGVGDTMRMIFSDACDCAASDPLVVDAVIGSGLRDSVGTLYLCNSASYLVQGAVRITCGGSPIVPSGTHFTFSSWLKSTPGVLHSPGSGGFYSSGIFRVTLSGPAEDWRAGDTLFVRFEDNGSCAGTTLNTIFPIVLTCSGSTQNIGTLTFTPTGVEVSAGMLSADLLLSTTPNPFTENVTITVSAPSDWGGKVHGRVLDLLGNTLAHLPMVELEAGSAVMNWDGRKSDGAKVASGVYLIEAQLGSERMVKVLCRE